MGRSVTITAQQAVDLITSSVPSFKTNTSAQLKQSDKSHPEGGRAGEGSRLCAQEGKHASATLEAPVGVIKVNLAVDGDKVTIKTDFKSHARAHTDLNTICRSKIVTSLKEEL